MPNPSIKNEKMYEELRKDGNSPEKSARIANAAAARGRPELKKRAKEIGLSGYSGLGKRQLVSKLRNS
jgi:ribosomal protein L32E